MAITSAEAVFRHVSDQRDGPSRREGEVVMIDVLACALVAVALSLPALVTATMGLESKT